jgi:hypothetical protein
VVLFEQTRNGKSHGMAEPASSLSRSTEVTAAERSRQILKALILERRDLRSTGADPVTLEANRLAITYWQRQLGRQSASQ